jgi:hypothetical protein
VQGEGARAFTTRLIWELGPLLARIRAANRPTEVAAVSSQEKSDP